MSDHSHPTPPDGCGDDVAAYALGALEPALTERFRHHLNTCAVCRDELESFQQIVEVLALTAPAYRAPARLRRRVLRAVAQEPIARSSTGRRARGRPRWSPIRAAMALGVALALAAAVLGGLDLRSSPSQAGARVIRAQVRGTGSAQLRVSRGRGELIVRRLAPPPAGEIYELWLVRGHGAAIPTTALFSVSAAGNGDVDVPGNLHGVARIMVTPEPSGGSDVPTHPAVINASLT